ncbi:MAG: response regulator, partial [Gammaproteobacteria bacterium]|nr:response regulator [Gammaproteobacteria bacterium]
MIRIILVDDHKLFRIGLHRMLQETHGLQIVGEAETGEEAVRLARELRPSIVLMDIWMPGIGGLEATRRIVRMQLDIKVIAVTACDENPFPLQVLKAGASGYLSKGVAAEELIVAIKKVFVGKRYVSSEIAQTLAMSTYEDGHRSPFEALSIQKP